jgi:membrane associated rhomboid family serine protease
LFSALLNGSSLPLARHQLVYAVIGANVAVYLLWLYGTALRKRGDRGLYVWLAQNFHLSAHGLLSDFRLGQLIFYQFSHTEFMHLLMNMAGIYFIGLPVRWTRD